MKRANDRQKLLIYIMLALVLLLGLSSFMKSVSKAIPATLRVPLIGQLGNSWCWAACSEMVSTYCNREYSWPVVTQCVYVDSLAMGVWGITLGCDTINAKHLPNSSWSDDLASIPFPTVGISMTSFGYTFSQYGGNKSLPASQMWHNALTPQQLQQAIADSMPVIFEWQWAAVTIESRDSFPGSNDHYLVAEGCPRSSYITPEGGWVSVNDPDPVPTGQHFIITYAEYASKKPTTIPGVSQTYVFCGHGTDYYNFSWKGTNK